MEIARMCKAYLKYIILFSDYIQKGRLLVMSERLFVC